MDCFIEDEKEISIVKYQGDSWALSSQDEQISQQITITKEENHSEFSMDLGQICPPKTISKEESIRQEESISKEQSITKEQNQLSLLCKLADEEKVVKMEMKHYNIQQKTVSFFELQLCNQTLSDEMKFIFGTVSTFFNVCLSNPGNYTLQANGIIEIDLEIKFAGKQSGKIEKKLSLHMISVQKPAQIMLSELIDRIMYQSQKEKLQKNKECLDMKQKIGQLQQKIKSYQYRIGPIHNSFLKHFFIQQKCVNITQMSSTLFLNTSSKNPNGFTMRVNFQATKSLRQILKNGQLVVGLASRSLSQNQIIHNKKGSKCIGYSFCQNSIYLHGKQIDKQCFPENSLVSDFIGPTKAPPYQTEQMIQMIQMVYKRKESKVEFKSGQKYRFPLGMFQNSDDLIPFITFNSYFELKVSLL